MNCCDHYDIKNENDTIVENLKAIRTHLEALQQGINKAYRQGFIDGYELAASTLED